MIEGLNRRAVALAAAALMFSTNAHASAAGKLAERLNAFKGQPVTEAFDRIGYPDRKETYGPDTVYYWGVDQPEGPSCTYNVAAGPDGLIKKASAYGNDWGCGPLAKRLKPNPP